MIANKVEIGKNCDFPQVLIPFPPAPSTAAAVFPSLAFLSLLSLSFSLFLSPNCLKTSRQYSTFSIKNLTSSSCVRSSSVDDVGTQDDEDEEE